MDAATTKAERKDVHYVDSVHSVHLRPFAHSPTPKKNPHGSSPCGASNRSKLDSLLAVAFLDSDVVSPVLAPDFHQGLATTTFASRRLSKILG